jgi:hypothetical protein
MPQLKLLIQSNGVTLLNTVDRIRDPTGVATEVVGMEERRARLRQATAASRRRGDHRAKEEERARLGLQGS